MSSLISRQFASCLGLYSVRQILNCQPNFEEIENEFYSFTFCLLVLAASDDQIYFSTKPKDKEAFVGQNVQFDWDYVLKEVQEVRFGVVIQAFDGGKEITAIYIKKKNGSSVRNNLETSIEWIRDRVVIVEDRRASFRINNIKMEDSVTFFCQVYFGREGLSEIDRVKLTVVGEY